MITAKKVGQSAQRSSHLDDEPLEGLLIAFPPHHAHDYHTCAARIWLHDRSELRELSGSGRLEAGGPVGVDGHHYAVVVTDRLVRRLGITDAVVIGLVR